MKFVVMIGVIFCLIQLGQVSNGNLSKNYSFNSTDPNKDMYVINAMVYQIGIITNQTDDKLNSTIGNQEALTVYRNKGSKIDLSDIPAPLLTNVTAESIVQVAPKQNISGENMGNPLVAWNDLTHLASLQDEIPSNKTSDEKPRMSRNAKTSIMSDKDECLDEHGFRSLFKRETADNKTTVKVVKGSIVVPQAAGVQSIAIPPLLTFNNNLTNIPVPIPNTSVVHYAKINTVVRNPTNT